MMTWKSGSGVECEGGQRGGDMCMRVTDSLRCTGETDTTL